MTIRQRAPGRIDRSNRATFWQRRLIALCVGVFAFFPSSSDADAEQPIGIADPFHGYWTEPVHDRFSQFKAEIESGRRQLDVSSEKAFLLSVLKELEVPVSSQLLVYSATSLQKGLINPRNPRALYFNEDTYVGYVPGGRIEIVSLDPKLGGIFYMFDPLRGARLPRMERSDRCMTCHAPHYLQEIPGLLIESVVPGMTGGGEKAFRREQSGHGVPLDQRLGGWHVTGGETLDAHWGNLMMEYTSEGRRERSIRMAELFDAGKYPRATSDIVAHLLHEHQVGFVNRAIQAAYQARVILREPRVERAGAELNKLAAPLVRYLLFVDEAPLPKRGVEGDPEFKADFLRTKKVASTGTSLKDLELRTRLLRWRCSYMIYSPSFSGLPSELKERVYAALENALEEQNGTSEFAYLPAEERRTIRTILKETLSDLPAGWGEEPAAGQ